MLVVCLTLPDAAARQLARESDPATAEDPGYILKSVVGEVLGHSVQVRPFRGLCKDGILKIVGFADVDEPFAPTASAEKLGCEVYFLPWQPGTGDEIWLDVLACPMQGVTAPKNPKEGERIPRERDIAASGKFPNRVAAYNAWLQQRLKAPESGCTPLSVVQITKTGEFESFRKGRSHNRQVHMLTMPMFAGKVKVRVEDADRFSRFLMTGVGRQRGFGYGAIIPKEVLHDIAN